MHLPYNIAILMSIKIGNKLHYYINVDKNNIILLI